MRRLLALANNENKRKMWNPKMNKKMMISKKEKQQIKEVKMRKPQLNTDLMHCQVNLSKLDALPATIGG